MAEVRCRACGASFREERMRIRGSEFCPKCSDPAYTKASNVFQDAYKRFIDAGYSDSEATEKASKLSSKFRERTFPQVTSKRPSYVIRCPSCRTILESDSDRDYNPGLCSSCSDRWKQERAEEKRRSKEIEDDIEREYR